MVEVPRDYDCTNLSSAYVCDWQIQQILSQRGGIKKRLDQSDF